MISQIKKPKGDVLGALDTARQKVQAIKAQRVKIDEASVSRAEVETAVAEGLDHLSGLASTGLQLGHLVAGNADLFRPNFQTIDIAGLLIALNRNGIEAMIKRDLDRLYSDGDGVSEAERKSQLALLKEELLAAERAEEMAVRAAEEAGFDIVRRADADPRAVLAK
ncbi:hypothetical protein B6V73_00080 [Thioclava sp. JM3]|uniref:hypothetical protein n=1 Tax=Thioclava sp. JM3 TaxID=1973004 RepID=UPI000B548ED1|nr:hypothetical protein [Thioclava sp. JM3]OWY18253.1 hypothetical protein B6V73_00080 [Thioclava sp. JM3]